MSRRSQRIISRHRGESLLQAAGECRFQVIRQLRDLPIHCDEYQACMKLLDAIDQFAESLTGNREHYWLKMPQATSNTSNSSDR
jgi:hypothetical protein